MRHFITTAFLSFAALSLSAQTEGETGTENQETPGSAKLAEIKVHNQKLSKFNKDQYDYVYNVFYNEKNEFEEGCITYTTLPGDSSSVTVDYNPATRIAQVQTKAIVGDSTHVYRIKFCRILHQLEDPSFEKYTAGNEPLYGWHSFASATGAAADFKNLSPQPVSVEGGANGSLRAVKLESSKVLGFVNANANMTTGAINMGSPDAKASSNYNYTNTKDFNNTFEFQAKPDSVVFYAKFKAGKQNKAKQGNANFILHKNCDYRDPEIDSLLNMRVAKASAPIVESENWKRYSVPFVYEEGNATPKYLLASVTTNPVPGESSGDVLYFDEVKFIYNSTLSALSIKGADFNFHPDTLNYDLRGSHYFKDSISYTATGIGSYVTKKFDAKTGLYTILVKGNDYNNVPENVRTYSLQFDTPDTIKVTDIKIFGTSLEGFDSKTTDYIVLNKDYEEGCIECVTSNTGDNQFDITYNPATRCATVKAIALVGGDTKTYTIKFDQALYQFEDAGFEKFTEGNEPLYGWHSFASATGNLNFAAALSPQPQSVKDGANGSERAVMLTSSFVIMANANGNLTTGAINMGHFNPTDASNHNYSNVGSTHNVLRFAGRPDSVSFYAKFQAGALNKEKVGRANFILHDECQYKDPEDSTQLNNRIAKASQLIAESKEWKKYTVDFAYDKKDYKGIQYLLASVTTNPVPGESANDTLYFDEVQFIYNHGVKNITLSDVKEEGEIIEMKENEFHYDLAGHTYSPATCLVRLNGVGATATKTFDTAKNILTVVVEGSDFAVNPNSVSTYTFQFDGCTGINNVTTNGLVTVYDLNGRLLFHNVKADAVKNLPAGIYVINGKKVVK